MRANSGGLCYLVTSITPTRHALGLASQGYLVITHTTDKGLGMRGTDDFFLQVALHLYAKRWVKKKNVVRKENKEKRKNKLTVQRRAGIRLRVWKCLINGRNEGAVIFLSCPVCQPVRLWFGTCARWRVWDGTCVCWQVCVLAHVCAGTCVCRHVDLHVCAGVCGACARDWARERG